MQFGQAQSATIWGIPGPISPCWCGHVILLLGRRSRIADAAKSEDVKAALAQIEAEASPAPAAIAPAVIGTVL